MCATKEGKQNGGPVRSEPEGKQPPPRATAAGTHRTAQGAAAGGSRRQQRRRCHHGAAGRPQPTRRRRRPAPGRRSGACRPGAGAASYLLLRTAALLGVAGRAPGGRSRKEAVLGATARNKRRHRRLAGCAARRRLGSLLVRAPHVVVPVGVVELYGGPDDDGGTDGLTGCCLQRSACHDAMRGMHHVPLLRASRLRAPDEVPFVVAASAHLSETHAPGSEFYEKV